MNTTMAIAVAGLATALLGTLAVPLITAYFASKRETAARTDERRYATYVDAITFAQLVEARLNEIAEDLLYRSHRKFPDLPDELMIRAKLVLVAPAGVTRAFDEVARAWEILGWNLKESGPVAVDGDDPVFFATEDDKDVVRLAGALKQLKSVIRPDELGELDN